jgi:hypothetical protein
MLILATVRIESVWEFSRVHVRSISVRSRPYQKRSIDSK